jgi:hypothetical protein
VGAGRALGEGVGAEEAAALSMRALLYLYASTSF